MPNPYESPIRPNEDQSAQAVVRGPATALIVVSLIAIICGSLALVVDVALLATGMAAKLEQMNEGPVSKQTQVAIRSVWGGVLVIASSFVLYGAIQMRNLKSYRTARAAAIVAMVPLLGPCCLLGIPFGIWAFVALGKPGVRDAFRAP
jgi:hypothetical protein